MYITNTQWPFITSSYEMVMYIPNMLFFRTFAEEDVS